MSDKKQPKTETPVEPEVEAPKLDANLEFAKALGQEIAAGIVAAQAINRQTDAASKGQVAHEKCQKCGQRVAGCKGKHVKMVVYPTGFPELAEYFRGICINEHWYLSNDAGHEIYVPADAAPGIAYAVQQAEAEERAARFGRPKTPQRSSAASSFRPQTPIGSGEFR